MSKPTADKPAQAKSWDRRPDELTMWYDRFLLYLSLGPMRSLLASYRKYRVDNSNGKCKPEDVYSTSASWEKYSKLYDWSERATAYDDHLNAIAQEQLETLAIQFKHERVRDLIKAWRKLSKAWDKADTESERSGPLASAMKNIGREIRLDLEGHSDRRSVDVQLLHKLPPEIQKLIEQALNQSQSGTK